PEKTMRIKPLLLSTSLICALTAPVWAMSHGDEGGPDHQMMWRQMDSDGDNRISKAEFTKSTEARFDKADANHDGYIDQSERDKMREKMHERMEKMREKHSKMPE
ncbi:MAG TPA: EF-hand domain-containing protein, partial [Pseudomonadales bacterium]|nr:EF-hand domain-containing protein [Pseudomonadales bacterium]